MIFYLLKIMVNLRITHNLSVFSSERLQTSNKTIYTCGIYCFENVF